MRTDPIADLLTRVRNAQRVGHKVVRVPLSNVSKSILDVLKEEGFIESYQQVSAGKFEELEISLKYYNRGRPAITLARRISSPGRRAYSSVKELPKVHCGLGISIVSTSQGVMSDRAARSKNIGGEVLALVSC
ncbi:MAG: 30S ribosomal protein S8 [Bdellovibrionales bacterium]|nr:30S ribosomal protein S8 [Bdellovibrionales bacterium]